MESEFDFEEIKAKAGELAEACKFQDICVSDDFLLVMLIMLLAISGRNVDKEENHDAE